MVEVPATARCRSTVVAVLALAIACAACDQSPIAPPATAPPQNTAPTVTVTFDGASSCTPQLRTPCTLTVVAQASDADGDPLTYTWSGCAGGTSSRATCTVERPGPARASVEVSDDHGHTAISDGTATGENRPPGVFIGYITVFPTGSIELLGQVRDPDEGYVCGREYCVTATASGACDRGGLQCTCLAGLEAIARRTAPNGLCTVTFWVKDSWGETGTAAVTFDINNPVAPRVTGGIVSPIKPER